MSLKKEKLSKTNPEVWATFTKLSDSEARAKYPQSLVYFKSTPSSSKKRTKGTGQSNSRGRKKSD